MESKYLFEDEYIGVSETHLHLLRNRFEYKTITIAEVETVTLKIGKAVKNWLILLIVGSIMLCSGIYFAYGVVEFFFSKVKRSIDIFEVVFPIFLVFVGGNFIYESLKKEKILEFKIGDQNHKFSIKYFEQQNQLEPLLEHLSKKTKVIV